MKKKLQFTRRMSIFLSSLLAYIILLSVPLIIGFAIYTQSISIINKEVKRANDAILTQAQQSLDSRLREVEELTIRIGLDSRVNGMLSVRDDIQVTHRYTMHEIINDFNAYIVANPFINSFYVYMRNSDIAIASNGSYDSRSLVAIWQGKGDKEYKEWSELNSAIHKNQFQLLDRMTSNGVANKMLAYTCPLPIGSAKNPSATLTIYLNEATLRDIVSKTKMINQGVVLVMNSKNEILFQTEPYCLPARLTYDMLNRGTGSIEEHIDGHDVVVSYISSTVADWVYITVVPVEVFMKEALSAQRMALASFCACVLLGGLLVFFFIRANYNPVRELVGTITRKSGISMHRGLNEYRFIQDVVSSIIEERNSIQSRLSQQELNLRNYHFARILKGNADNIPFESTCQYYKLDLKSSQFSLLLFCLVDFDPHIWKDSSAATDIVFGMLRNTVEDLAVKCGHTGVMVEVDDFYACLINMLDESDHRELLLSIAQEAVSLTEENFGLRFTVSVSGPAYGNTAIPSLYQQALEAIEYLQLTGKKQIMHYDELKAKPGESLPHKSYLQQERRFVNCLRAGDYADAKRIVNEMIVGNYLSDPAMSIDLVKCRLFGLVNTAINNLQELSLLYETQYFKKEKPVERLLNCHSIQELQQCFNVLLDEMGGLEARTGNDDGLVDKAKSYIAMNCRDINLNVSTLAEQFGTTTANLSKQFKRKTGMGLLDYIHRCRLDNAKELLLNRRINIRDISMQSGFIDSDAFIRVFKKYEGVTPGRYRETFISTSDGEN